MALRLLELTDGLVTTRSEAIQKMFQKKGCPYIWDCNVGVTKDFFIRICNSEAYLKCHHFARRVDELKTPIAWIQTIAIHGLGQIVKSTKNHATPSDASQEI